MNSSNALQIKYYKDINLNKFECFCFLLIIILFGWAPAHESSTLGSEQLVLLCKLFRWGMVLFILFIEIWKAFVYGLHIKWLALIPIPYYVMIFFNSYDNEMFPIIGLLTIMLFLNLSAQSKVWIYRQYRRWIIFMSLMGIICYLSYVFKLGIPYKIVQYYSIINEAEYINYFHYSYIYADREQIRLCGLFNEPGYLGTIIGLILVAERLNLKRIGNGVMFVAGCCTFSLAFVVLLIMAFVLQNVQRIKIFLLIPILVVGLCNIISNIYIDNYGVQRIINRVRFEEGKLVGDNRMTWKYENVCKDVLDNSIWFGKGSGYIKSSENRGVGGLSYMNVVIEMGVVGFFVLYATYFLELFFTKMVNLTTLPFIICFFASHYQRPVMYDIHYMMLLFSGLVYIVNNKRKDKC